MTPYTVKAALTVASMLCRLPFRRIIPGVTISSPLTVSESPNVTPRLIVRPIATVALPDMLNVKSFALYCRLVSYVPVKTVPAM